VARGVELSGWVDEWDLVLRNGNVAEETRVVYMRSVRQFLDHMADGGPVACGTG
jgi:hypothetical protein